MAKIIIELDTNNGDTLDTVRQALLGSAAMPNVAAQDVFDPNAYSWKFSDRVLTDEEADAQQRLTGAAAAAGHRARDVPVANAEPQIADKTVWVNNPDAPLTEYDGDRKRGTAGPNGGRRTKAQIESDTRYFAQVEAAKADAAAACNPDVKPITFKTAEDAVAAMEAGVEPAISTGAERINPQDAADEEAARPEATGEPTLEDLRRAYTRYADKFGAPAAIKDVRAILGCGVIDVPSDKIADGIAKIDAAIAAADIDKHLTATTAEPAAPVAPATATVAELMAAIMGYAAKYDRTDEPDLMIVTKEDLPKLFTELFGAGVTGIGSMPGAVGKDYSKVKPEDFGKVLAAIRDATEKNTFNRKVLA